MSLAVLASGRLFGRDDELRQLEVARRYASRQGSLVLLSGEAGIGKSRLVAAFLAGLPRRQHTLAIGRSVEYLRTPYATFSQALGSIDPATASLLCSPSSDVRAKSALFAAVVDSIRKEADRRNTIIVLEDVHWADDGTLELLDYIARAVATIRRILIVVTFRQDNPHGAKLTEIARNDTAQRIHLKGLGDEPMRDLVRAHLETSVASREESIVKLAAGNPFFAEELCISSRESAIPQSLLAVIEQRLAVLSLDEMRTLTCAAIFSDTVELDILAECLGSPPLDVAQLLERSQRVGLLIEDSIGFSFRHGEFNESVQHSDGG